ncbi:MAG: alpha/beta hydrolase [Gammaproteobacteria bacterium]|nr:alpha/beta hydrolase [Gammaproteobacteria bacterium]MCP5423643.1 alpha/beta hydrolase [Gammaproteobacteria bacterium]MCP5459896.1 alpha/beta hydrolase [Gammaproteobacteria bacterium]
MRAQRWQCPADDGETIHLAVVGEGPPMIFLHGWTSSRQEWLPYGKQVADLRQVFCWDARAHGGHPLSNATPPSVQRLARDLHEVIAHFRLRPVLMGHSMGALIIWEYLRHWGCDDLAGLCLVDQSPKLVTDEQWRLGIYEDFSAERNAAFIQEMHADFAEAVLRLAANGRNPRIAASYQRNSAAIQVLRKYLRTQNAEALIALWESFCVADYREVLERISVPTLLIYGGASTFYSQATAHYVKGHIPRAVLRIYEDADHSPHLWQPQRFVDDLRAFLLSPGMA